MKLFKFGSRDPLVAHAIDSFQKKYPGRKVLHNWIRKAVIGRDGSKVVTVVWDWGGIPPRRSWWRYETDGSDPVEIDSEDASKIIEIPVWR